MDRQRLVAYTELTLNPNQALDRNVLISIVLLLLLAVWHKYISRLSSNDRFGLKSR